MHRERYVSQPSLEHVNRPYVHTVMNTRIVRKNNCIHLPTFSIREPSLWISVKQIDEIEKRGWASRQCMTTQA